MSRVLRPTSLLQKLQDLICKKASGYYGCMRAVSLSLVEVQAHQFLAPCSLIRRLSSSSSSTVQAPFLKSSDGISGSSPAGQAHIQ